MWEPQHLTTLWAFTACYRDSITFFYLYLDNVLLGLRNTMWFMNDGSPAHYTIIVTELSGVQWMALEAQNTGQLDLKISAHDFCIWKCLRPWSMLKSSTRNKSFGSGFKMYTKLFK
jgi:hypothetical protein